MKQILMFVLILIIANTGCNVKESANEEHDHSEHDHGEVKLQIVKYTDQFELFAEADPFSKNISSEVLAHFTKLPDFKPLNNAAVTAVLKVGDSEIKQTIETPDRPGIYKFSLKPEKNGSGKLIFEINTEKKYKVEADVVIYGDEHTADHIAEKKQIENVNAITFTKEQSWKIDFATVHPKNEQFGKVIKTTAQVLPNQHNEAIITAKTNGMVKLRENILEGQELIAGKTLFTISGKGLANDNTEVRFLEAKNNYEAAKADYDRKLALSKDQIVSEKELESSKADYENAKAVFDNLKNNFNENGQVIVAPRNGIVKHVFVKNGEYVETGDPLFSLSNNNTLIINAEVQQKNFPYLSSISSFNIKSSTDNRVYSQKDLNGMLLSYGKNIDQNEGYLIPLNFQVDNKISLLPGSFVDIYIKTKSDQETLTVPNSSLVEEYGNYFVLVQVTPEMFEKREVKTGLSDGLKTEIISGLSEGERIVSKGAIIVKLAAVSNTLDAHSGHVH